MESTATSTPAGVASRLPETTASHASSTAALSTFYNVIKHSKKLRKVTHHLIKWVRWPEMMSHVWKHTFKSLIWDGNAVSVHRPGFYSDRFLNFIGKFVFIPAKTKPNVTSRITAIKERSRADLSETGTATDGNEAGQGDQQQPEQSRQKAKAKTATQPTSNSTEVDYNKYSSCRLSWVIFMTHLFLLLIMTHISFAIISFFSLLLIIISHRLWRHIFR